MNGSAAGSYGLAVASYDWLAAMGLAIVAMFILPRILRAGIYTMPEYLEHRYSPAARNLMSHYMVGIYTLVTIPAVLYTGGLAIHTMFDLNLTAAVWIVAITATIYTTYGGLKSVAWADLFQGTALLAGGLLVTVAGLPPWEAGMRLSPHNRGPTPHDSARGPSGVAVDRAPVRTVDSQSVLLGLQPVHHAADARRPQFAARPVGCADGGCHSTGAAAGDCLPRLDGPTALPGGAGGHTGQGLPAADQEPDRLGLPRVCVCGDCRSGDQYARVDAQLGGHDLHDRRVSATLATGGAGASLVATGRVATSASCSSAA